MIDLHYYNYGQNQLLNSLANCSLSTDDVNDGIAIKCESNEIVISRGKCNRVHQSGAKDKQPSAIAGMVFPASVNADKAI